MPADSGWGGRPSGERHLARPIGSFKRDVQRSLAALAGAIVLSALLSTPRPVDHVATSPQLPRLAMIWTYDEAGGFADHVPPEQHGCAPGGGSSWTQRGPRIPLVVVSPWVRRSFASHVVRDHTSITRFIETVFGLPALTERDANSDALLDLFDFSCGRDLTLPAGPAAGTGGCVR